MAKAQIITGLNPAEPARASLPAVFDVRIAELWSWAEYLKDPQRVRELHDMRIAAKRLRYLFEIYAPCFSAELDEQLAQFKRLQNYLGEIHDCDVWVDYLRLRLDEAFVDLIDESKALRRFKGAQAGLEAEATELSVRLAGGPAQALAAFIAEVAGRRCRLYDELLAFWAELEVAEFRRTLTDAVNAVSGGAEDRA